MDPYGVNLILRITKLFIASRNKGKIEEIKSCLEGLDLKFFSLLDAPDIHDIPETGKTYGENAWLKAKAVYDFAKIPVIADDSGLEVVFLGGRPGVHSSRYSGENATDDENISKLLIELENAEFDDRAASFKCVAVYYDGTDKKVFEGVCRGIILNKKRGSGGFGYDPLFVPDGFAQTFAELEPEIKNKISHRGKALEKLRQFLSDK